MRLENLNKTIDSFIKHPRGTSYDAAQKIITYNLEECLSNTERINKATELISFLKEKLNEHQQTCKEPSNCVVEHGYKKIIRFVEDIKRPLALSMETMTFEEKKIKIYEELVIRPNKEGDLEEILQYCDIPYERNDLRDFIDDFNSTKHIRIKAASKDGYYIALTQTGLDYLKQPRNYKIDYQDSLEKQKMLWRQLLGKGKFSQLFEELQAWAERRNDKEFNRKVVHSSARWSSLRSDKNQGLISRADFDMNQNLIIESLTDLIYEA